MTRHLFGTDGIRGVAGEPPLTPETIHALGRALVGSGLGRLLIGRDTRSSGPWIEAALRAGIEAEQGEAVSVGVIPTPGVSFLCRDDGFDAGVVISASHNPYRDNGIKIFGPNGLKLSDRQEAALERRIDPEPGLEAPGVRECEPPEARFYDRERVDRYTGFLVSTAAGECFAGSKIALDCAHGAAFAVAPEVFRRLGAEVVLLGTEPDGSNINRGRGALHPEGLIELVRREKADAGLAFDGDADRLILVDESGRLRDGDHVLFLLSHQFSEEDRLPTRTVVTTVMANIGLEVALRRDGLDMLRTRVGDRYVLEAMLEGGHHLGGEQSGHTIVRDHAMAGDGILTAIQVLLAMRRSRQPLSRLCGGLEKYPQVLLNVSVAAKPDFSEIPAIQQEIDRARERLGDEGRIVIRYSGTEPLARVMVEGPRRETIEALARGIADRFRSELGGG